MTPTIEQDIVSKNAYHLMQCILTQSRTLSEEEQQHFNHILDLSVNEEFGSDLDMPEYVELIYDTIEFGHSDETVSLLNYMHAEDLTTDEIHTIVKLCIEYDRPEVFSIMIKFFGRMRNLPIQYFRELYDSGVYDVQLYNYEGVLFSEDEIRTAIRNTDRETLSKIIRHNIYDMDMWMDWASDHGFHISTQIMKRLSGHQTTEFGTAENPVVVSESDTTSAASTEILSSYSNASVLSSDLPTPPGTPSEEPQFDFASFPNSQDSQSQFSCPPYLHLKDLSEFPGSAFDELPSQEMDHTFNSPWDFT